MSYLLKSGLGNVFVRKVAPVRTDNNRPVQFHMREVYCGGREQKRVTETKGRKERKESVKVKRVCLLFRL